MASRPLENRLQTVSFGIILPPPGTGASERSGDRNPQECDYCSDVAFHTMIHTHTPHLGILMSFLPKNVSRIQNAPRRNGKALGCDTLTLSTHKILSWQLKAPQAAVGSIHSRGHKESWEIFPSKFLCWITKVVWSDGFMCSLSDTSTVCSWLNGCLILFLN